jgi:hypothetical protein
LARPHNPKPKENTMNIPILEGKTAREKLANFTASVEKLRSELKSLDFAILEGDIAAAQRHGVIMTQLHAIDRVHPVLTKSADKERREGQGQAISIRLQANDDLRHDRVSIRLTNTRLKSSARPESNAGGHKSHQA